MNGLPASTAPQGSHRLYRYIHEKEAKKILDYIYSLLAKMKEHYCVYIGTKDLDRLATFVSGYECALFDLLGIQSQFKTIEAVLGTSLLGDVGIWASTALFIAQQSTALLKQINSTTPDLH